MYMPFVNSGAQKHRRQVVRFGGLNRTQNFQEGELADGVGLSCREWPCLSQRLGRKTVRQAFASGANGFAGVYAWDQLVTVTAWGELGYGGKTVGTLTPGKKQFAAVNTKLCIWPDKKYLDLDTQELHDLGARVETLASSVVFGEDYLELRAPRSILGEYQWQQNGIGSWLADFTFKVFSEEDLRWDSETGWANAPYTQKMVTALRAGDCLMLPRSENRGDRNPDYADGHGHGYAAEFDTWGDYVYITENVEGEIGTGSSYFLLKMERRNAAGKNPDLSEREIQAGDTVTISGCVTHEENNVDIRISAIDSGKVTFDSPVLTPGFETGTVVLERKVPELDYICESDNRLVGVSNADKTIYISALGDPRNFYDYRGLSVSSSYIPVGSSGDFTGCIAYGGNVLLMKEDCMHRLMGDYDGNFSLYTDQVAGVQAGSAGSMVILNEVLYYKGREGVYAYTGSTPSLISAALGDVRYQNAEAGTDGQRYYISMERTDDQGWELLAYDIRTGLWMLEERRQAGGFAWKDGRLYMISDVSLYALAEGETDKGMPGTADQAIAWEATFTPFDETSHNRKYPSRLLLRFELGEGAWVEAELSRDGGPYQHVWTSHRPGPTAVIPIRPGRCDKYQLRLKGEGQCVLRSMAREFSLGGVR